MAKYNRLKKDSDMARMRLMILSVLLVNIVIKIQNMWELLLVVTKIYYNLEWIYMNMVIH